MKKFYNKFLIISSFLLVLGGLFVYSYNDVKSNGVVPVAFGSSLESSTGASSPLATSNDSQISSDISFLSTLVSLKNITIDTSIFESESFNKLQNNVVKIEPVVAGRVNPFAPMDSINNRGTSLVTTNLPTQITEQTAVFNGTINSTNGSADTYFEYGTEAQGLDNVTAITKQSLVGTFIKSVTGLSPRTNYLFKACAKINNVAICGETVSFTTK